MMTLRRPPRRGFGEQPATLAAIQNLFARGELGGYWPADPQYAYEDSAGTTLASVNGVVGLRYDVSKGLALGPELITDGTFDIGLTGWNLVQSLPTRGVITWQSPGLMRISGDGTYYPLASKSILTIGNFYRITLDVLQDTGSGVWRVQAGNTTKELSGLGNKSVVLQCITDTNFSVLSYKNGTVDVDNISVKQIAGNHAIQATTANKPYLRQTPVSGKYWYDSNTATGALTATFSSSLGSACTIATVTPEGVSILDNQTVGTTYNICLPYDYSSDVLIINRALTAAEKALVTRILKRNAPYYPSIVDARLQMRGYAPNNENTVDTSIITNFYVAWYGCSGLTSFPLINTAAGTSFYAAWYGCSGLTSFPLINTAAGTNFSVAWSGCSSLASFPLINTAAGTNFSNAWSECSSLTSFPLINTAAGTNFSVAWYGCSSLASFPLINTAAGTNFSYAWYGCSGLTSFPLINTAAGTNFSVAWYGCSSLTSFPLINTAAGTNFSFAWYGCSGLTSFPANFFDSWTGVPIANCFSSTWESCIKLTLASVQNIVVSLVVSGKSAPATGTDISLDGAPTLVAIQADTTVMTAVATLKSRNWTPKYKGTAL